MRRTIALSLLALFGLAATAEAGFRDRFKARRDARQSCAPAGPAQAPAACVPAAAPPAALAAPVTAGGCLGGACAAPRIPALFRPFR